MTMYCCNISLMPGYMEYACIICCRAACCWCRCSSGSWTAEGEAAAPGEEAASGEAAAPREERGEGVEGAEGGGEEAKEEDDDDEVRGSWGEGG